MEFLLIFFKLTTVCLPVWNWSISVFRVKWLSWLVESDLIFCGVFCVFVAESELLAYGHISWSVFTQGIRESHGSMPRALSSIPQLRAFSKQVKHKTSAHIMQEVTVDLHTKGDFRSWDWQIKTWAFWCHYHSMITNVYHETSQKMEAFYRVHKGLDYYSSILSFLCAVQFRYVDVKT